MAHGPSVTLRNKRRRMQVFNLPYQIMGPRYMKRQLTGALRYNGKTGEKKVRGGMKRVSDSLTLCAKGRPGDSVTGLPPTVVRCPDVIAAKKRGDIDVLCLDGPATESQAKALKEAEAAARKSKAAHEAAAQAKLAARMAPPPPKAEAAEAEAPPKAEAEAPAPKKHPKKLRKAAETQAATKE